MCSPTPPPLVDGLIIQATLGADLSMRLVRMRRQQEGEPRPLDFTHRGRSLGRHFACAFQIRGSKLGLVERFRQRHGQFRFDIEGLTLANHHAPPTVTSA